MNWIKANEVVINGELLVVIYEDKSVADKTTFSGDKVPSVSFNCKKKLVSTIAGANFSCEQINWIANKAKELFNE